MPSDRIFLTVMKSPSASPTNVISVLIADDHPVVREGLAAIFKSQKDIKVVAEATNGDEACELASQFSPDVLLLDPADAEEGWTAGDY